MDSHEIHEPKIRETVVRVKGHEYPRVIVDFGNLNGSRTRKTFKTRRVAERAVATWKAEQKILKRRIGEGAERFLIGDVQDAAAAFEVLGPGVTLTEAATMFKAVREAGLSQADIQDAAAGLNELARRATLYDAAKFYIKRQFPDGGERTVDALVEDYIASRVKANRRAATIRDIRGNLGRGQPANVEREGAGTLHLKPTGFAHDFVGVPVAHVTTKDLEKWMEQHSGKADATCRNIRVHLVGLFNFAMARKYVPENPAESLLTPDVDKSAKRRPYVMPVEDVEKLLRYAATNEPATVPYFALCVFAGIRPQGEIGRLSWGDVHFDRREIDIRKEISKTGDERFIEMSENLIAWLMPHRQAQGLIYAARAAVEAVREKAGVRWEPDCMRHSFGSYHMAHFENAGKTALQMGHRTIDTTFEHYRRAVRKEDAARFWQIVPNNAGNIIDFGATAG